MHSFGPFLLSSRHLMAKTNSLKFLSKVKTLFPHVAAPLTQDLIHFAAKDSTIERQACPWWESPDNCCNYDLQIAVSIRIKYSRDCKWPGEGFCLFLFQNAWVPQGSRRRCLIRRKAYLNTSRCCGTQKKDSTKVKHANLCYKGWNKHWHKKTKNNYNT